MRVRYRRCTKQTRPIYNPLINILITFRPLGQKTLNWPKWSYQNEKLARPRSIRGAKMQPHSLQRKHRRLYTKHNRTSSSRRVVRFSNVSARNSNDSLICPRRSPNIHKYVWIAPPDSRYGSPDDKFPFVSQFLWSYLYAFFNRTVLSK